MRNTSWLEIDLSQLHANVQAWRRILQGDGGSDKDGHCAPTSRADAAMIPPQKAGDGRTRVMFCGVVKADAYGLGALPIARCLVDAGADMLCVYDARQAHELVEAKVAAPVLILQAMQHLPCTEPFVAAVRGGRVHVSIDSAAQLRMTEDLGRAIEARVPVHLHLDTGMGRAGLNGEQFTAAIRRTHALPHVRVAGVYTHFATARDNPAYADEQLAAFDRSLSKLPEPMFSELIVHAASSLAAARHRRYHRTMVRVGLGMYGYAAAMLDPEADGNADALTRLGAIQPVLRWLARIVHLQRYPCGATIGYGRTHTLQRDSLIGVVPAGYGDGYPIALGNHAVVRLVRSNAPTPITAPVVGQVSMDQITIDLTDAENRLGLVSAGDVVELIGADVDSPCALPKLAALAGSNCYEMLCRLSARLPRVYAGDRPRPVIVTDALRLAAAPTRRWNDPVGSQGTPRGHGG